MQVRDPALSSVAAVSNRIHHHHFITIAHPYRYHFISISNSASGLMKAQPVLSAHARRPVLAMGLCLCVRYKPVLYRNGCTD